MTMWWNFPYTLVWTKSSNMLDLFAMTDQGYERAYSNSHLISFRHSNKNNTFVCNRQGALQYWRLVTYKWNHSIERSPIWRFQNLMLVEGVVWQIQSQMTLSHHVYGGCPWFWAACPWVCCRNCGSWFCIWVDNWQLSTKFPDLADVIVELFKSTDTAALPLKAAFPKLCRFAGRAQRLQVRLDVRVLQGRAEEQRSSKEPPLRNLARGSSRKLRRR